MADMSDLSPIQQMTLLEHCSNKDLWTLHGLLSGVSYSPSVEEMETEEEKTARKAYIKRCMTALLLETEEEMEREVKEMEAEET